MEDLKAGKKKSYMGFIQYPLTFFLKKEYNVKRIMWNTMMPRCGYKFGHGYGDRGYEYAFWKSTTWIWIQLS